MVPGKPEASELVRRIRGQAHPRMPFDGPPYLSDDEIREAVKEYASWPTFPQLWVRGELIGGNDIMVEMTATGELEALLRAGSS